LVFLISTENLKLSEKQARNWILLKKTCVRFHQLLIKLINKDCRNRMKWIKIN
jgi:hypothetical protein